MPTRRKDPVAEKRLLNAVRLWVVSMVCFGVSLFGAIQAPKDSPANGWATLASSVFLLAVFVTTVNVFRLRLFKRCPQCGASISQVAGLKPGEPILYLCPVCDVEWDIGWKVQESSSD